MSSEPDSPEYDFGYDPTQDEPIEITPPPSPLITLPASANVNTKYLPPVSKQGQVPSCAAWASIYGLATFTAALAGDYTPDQPTLQASPAYIYVEVMEQDGMSQANCSGSQIMTYFKILAGGGTPSMSQAPYQPDCTTLWQDYGSQTLSPDAAFTISSVAAVNAKKPDDVKQIIASGCPLVYGTSVYTDFPTYNGTPVPYVGNGTIHMKNGKPTGHCMLIIGYDDKKGAFHIQNSFGTSWGEKGFVWMAYDTFTTLAQGKAIYVNS